MFPFQHGSFTTCRQSCTFCNEMNTNTNNAVSNEWIVLCYFLFIPVKIISTSCAKFAWTMVYVYCINTSFCIYSVSYRANVINITRKYGRISRELCVFWCSFYQIFLFSHRKADRSRRVPNVDGGEI